MSLDERMRAALRTAAGTHSIDTPTAWEEIQMKAQRDHTRRNVVLVAAAAAVVAAGVAWGPGIVDSLSGSGEAIPVDQPSDEVIVDDGAVDDTQQADPPLGSPTDPGTYTYDRGPFPVTFTTTETTYDMSRGGDPYRVLVGELGGVDDVYGFLTFDFPVTAADLTVLATADGPIHEIETANSGVPDMLMAGPIDFPTDVGAWLESAVSLSVVDQGTLSRPDGEAAWWDVELIEPSARCFPEDSVDGDDLPCVVLWPYLEEKAELFDRQIGEFVRDSARVYAIQDGDEPLVAVAYTGFEAPESPEEDLALWVRTTDAIVSTITLG